MKFRYYLFNENGEVTGTNSTAVAKQASDPKVDTGYLAIVDTETGKDIFFEDGSVASEIQQQTTYAEE